MDTQQRLSDYTTATRNELAETDAVKFLGVLATSRSTNQAIEQFTALYPRSIYTKRFAGLMQRKDALPGMPLDASPAWGSELVAVPELAAGLLQFARQFSIVDRLGLTRSPFNVAVPRDLGGLEEATLFRGPGSLKMAVNASFATTSLLPLTVGGIIAFSKELARLTNGAAVSLLREILARGLVSGIDRAFFSTTAATSEEPGGVLEGLSAVTTTNDAAADLKLLVTEFVAQGGSLADAMLVLSSENAVGAKLSGNVAFADLRRDGGDAAGIPAVAGAGVGTSVVLIDKSKVLLAMDDAPRIDSSQEATLTLSGSPAEQVSLFQKNLVGLRVERAANWSVATGGVAFIADADYLAGGSPA